MDDLCEKIQDDLICVLDGMDDNVINAACQAVVDRFKKEERSETDANEIMKRAEDYLSRLEFIKRLVQIGKWSTNEEARNHAMWLATWLHREQNTDQARMDTMSELRTLFGHKNQIIRDAAVVTYAKIV